MPSPSSRLVKPAPAAGPSRWSRRHTQLCIVLGILLAVWGLSTLAWRIHDREAVAVVPAQNAPKEAVEEAPDKTAAQASELRQELRRLHLQQMEQRERLQQLRELVSALDRRVMSLHLTQEQFAPSHGPEQARREAVR